MFSGLVFSSSAPLFILADFLKPGGSDDDSVGRTNMFTKSAAGAIFGNNRLCPLFKIHGPPFNRATFITGTTEKIISPCVTFFTVQHGKTHPYFFNGHVMESVRGTDLTAAHTEMAGRLFGINLRCAGNEKIKTPPHLDTVKNTDLRTLAALKTTG
jgi:hypothetical protein